MNCTTGLPPSNDGVKTTVIAVFPMVAVPIVGAVGTPGSVTAFDGIDDALVPFAFVAVTIHTYVLAFDSPATTVGDALLTV